MRCNVRIWVGPTQVNRVVKELMPFVTAFAGTEHVWFQAHPDKVRTALKEAKLECYLTSLEIA